MLISLLVFHYKATAMDTCGGLSEAKDADDSIQKICDKTKACAEKKAGVDFSLFTAIIYKTQNVPGMNYFIKVHVGGDVYTHIRVHQNLPCEGGELELNNIQYPRTLSDPIEYF
ncbi:cystatin-B [Oryzias melastigma]|uniref:Cystatin-B n=1 Tax=Oryzias melastigma TaxID=30732 RepID=A0A3B3D5M1_ORYME|nr:cystatin-B [Oryzias melastigma]